MVFRHKNGSGRIKQKKTNFKFSDHKKNLEKNWFAPHLLHISQRFLKMYTVKKIKKTILEHDFARQLKRQKEKKIQLRHGMMLSAANMITSETNFWFHHGWGNALKTCQAWPAYNYEHGKDLEYCGNLGAEEVFEVAINLRYIPSGSPSYIPTSPAYAPMSPVRVPTTCWHAPMSPNMQISECFVGAQKLEDLEAVQRDLVFDIKNHRGNKRKQPDGDF